MQPPTPTVTDAHRRAAFAAMSWRGWTFEAAMAHDTRRRVIETRARALRQRQHNHTTPTSPMAEITLTLRDTPEGGVSVRSQYAPAVGAHPTAAQKLAIDLHSQAVRRAMAPTLVDVAPQTTEGNTP